jgi:hypothetical protein
MSDEDKTTTLAAAPVEEVNTAATSVAVAEEKPKSEKKSKDKAPKSPKTPKKNKEKKAEADAAPDAGHAAEEKPVEEEKAQEEKPVEAAVAAKEDKVEVPKEDKKEKKDKEKKEKKEKAPKEEAAPAVVEEKKEEKKEEKSGSVSARGRSNSKVTLKTPQQIEEEQDTAETIRLWHQNGNVRSSRVLWLLKEIGGVVAEHLKVSLQTSHKEKREGFAALNPTGEAPTLRFGKHDEATFSLFEPGTSQTHTPPRVVGPFSLALSPRPRNGQLAPENSRPPFLATMMLTTPVFARIAFLLLCHCRSHVPVRLAALPA